MADFHVSNVNDDASALRRVTGRCRLASLALHKVPQRAVHDFGAVRQRTKLAEVIHHLHPVGSRLPRRHCFTSDVKLLEHVCVADNGEALLRTANGNVEAPWVLSEANMIASIAPCGCDPMELLAAIFVRTLISHRCACPEPNMHVGGPRKLRVCCARRLPKTSRKQALRHVRRERDAHTSGKMSFEVEHGRKDELRSKGLANTKEKMSVAKLVSPEIYIRLTFRALFSKRSGRAACVVRYNPRRNISRGPRLERVEAFYLLHIIYFFFNLFYSSLLERRCLSIGNSGYPLRF